jgi:hypothetical protein
MALRLKELQPATDFTYICTPTGDELPEMFEHWRLLGSLLGKPLQPIMGGTLDGLIARQRGRVPSGADVQRDFFGAMKWPSL